MRRFLAVSALMGAAICTLIPMFLVVSPMEVGCSLGSVVKSQWAKGQQNYIWRGCAFWDNIASPAPK